MSINKANAYGRLKVARQRSNYSIEMARIGRGSGVGISVGGGTNETRVGLGQTATFHRMTEKLVLRLKTSYVLSRKVPAKDSLLQYINLSCMATKYSSCNFGGTSMACPHVAGVATLLRGSKMAQPGQSKYQGYLGPNSSRTLLMITNQPLFSQSYQPQQSPNPRLVYNVRVQDYHITTITRSSSNNCSKPSLDLNYPSFIAFFSGNGSSNESRKTWESQRTVTNVGEGQNLLKEKKNRCKRIHSPPNCVVTSIIKGFHVSIILSKLAFKKEKISYKLTIVGPKIEGFGYLTWTNIKHVVRSLH
ncbi:Subtilisin-like protease SBT1.9, partial [Mucuna pruriens]